MKPPNSTKSAVYQWNTALLDTCHQLGEFSCSKLVIALSLVRTDCDKQKQNKRHVPSLYCIQFICFFILCALVFQMSNEFLNRSANLLKNLLTWLILVARVL